MFNLPNKAPIRDPHWLTEIVACKEEIFGDVKLITYTHAKSGRPMLYLITRPDNSLLEMHYPDSRP